MKFILAEKKEMTQLFGADGSVIPVTRVVAGPCVVVQTKTVDRDGYTAVQLAFGATKNLKKPQLGHLKKFGQFRYLKEFKVTADQAKQLPTGQKITVTAFQPGDMVKVSGTSKGRGFQGVVKRHHFRGQKASHGHKDQLRHSGSIGAGGVQHVLKGMRMGGRMGGNQVTMINLEVIKVDPDTNTLYIKGAVPGARNNLLLISGPGDIIIEMEPTPEAVSNQAEVKVETLVASQEPAVAVENKTEAAK